MTNSQAFEHLPLLLRFQGRAKLQGGGKPSPQTIANKKVRAQHSATLGNAAQSLSSYWKTQADNRKEQDLPVLPAGKPILVQVDTNLNIDVLREKFDFEIVAEQEDGYVLVSAEDLELTLFTTMVEQFAVEIHGSARIAEVHKLYDEPDQLTRVQRILSEGLLSLWPNIPEDNQFVVDIGVACAGTIAIPKAPKRGKRDTDADWARKEAEWSNKRSNAYNTWEELCATRQTEFSSFVSSYNASIMEMSHDDGSAISVLPDSFTVRIQITGKGLKDLVLNYAYIFEITEPEDIALPQYADQDGATPLNAPEPQAPSADAPAVCVIDSGIQEGHALLEPAIDKDNSYCFLPGESTTDIGDQVRPGGHGTRVAGAILYGESVPSQGEPVLEFWIQNARILDKDNSMPKALFPPSAIKAAIEKFHLKGRRTRLFNHSINTTAPSRTRYMSAWAAEIDLLSHIHDILVIQSAGNIPETGYAPQIGIKQHLAASRTYPNYLVEAACRIANPAQSLQALTVGSVGYDAFTNAGWSSFATYKGQISAFSRTGFGLWGIIKPEVVEYGGDAVYDQSNPPNTKIGSRVPNVCPELVRSTMYPPGPAASSDTAGTSFAAPKVSRIAAYLQLTLPDQPSLLYRALIVQSAQWPDQAEAILNKLRFNRQLN